MKNRLRWIIVTLGLTLLFCSSFVYFYQQAQQAMLSAAKEAEKPKGLDKPLPEARLVDLADGKLDDQLIRSGKVVLVFVTADCDACKREAEFLKNVVGKQEKVRFYGVIPYGDQKSSLTAAEKIFPFKVFYDDGLMLAGTLGINRVPVKLFLEDGVIRKAWGGATTDREKQVAFVQWLDDLR